MRCIVGSERVTRLFPPLIQTWTIDEFESSEKRISEEEDGVFALSIDGREVKMIGNNREVDEILTPFLPETSAKMRRRWWVAMARMVSVYWHPEKIKMKHVLTVVIGKWGERWMDEESSRIVASCDSLVIFVSDGKWWRRNGDSWVRGEEFDLKEDGSIVIVDSECASQRDVEFVSREIVKVLGLER